MGLKAILDTVDDLPEPVREFYKEDGGKFVLDLEDVDNHPKVRGVVTANRENVKKRDTLKKQVDELTAKLSAIPDDFDPEELATLRAEVAKMDPAKRDEAIQKAREAYEAKIAKLEKASADALAAKDVEIGERDGYIDRSVRDAGLKDALLEIGVNPDLLDGALATLRPSVKVVRTDDGNRKAVVETDLGEQTIPQYVKEWAGSKGKAYIAPATGPGPKGNNRSTVAGAKTMTRGEWDALQPADRMAKVKDGYKVVSAA
jgi:hypothetical protein